MANGHNMIEHGEVTIGPVDIVKLWRRRREDVLVALEHHTDMDMITPSGEVIGVMDFTIKQLELYEIPFVELLPLVKPKDTGDDRGAFVPFSKISFMLC